VKRLPFAYEERSVRREIDFLAHVDTNGGKAMANDVMPRSHKALPKFLSMAEIKSLLAAAQNPHHRMMMRLALHTGLRREEIAAFPLAYVFDPDKAGRTERNLRIRLDPFDGSGMVTKGSKSRNIYFSCVFMAELYRYMTKVRGGRASLSKPSPKALFLNQSGGTLCRRRQEPQPDHQQDRQTGWNQGPYAYAPAFLCHPYPSQPSA
jgi:site-specific recombinase XerD